MTEVQNSHGKDEDRKGSQASNTNWEQWSHSVHAWC